MALNLKWVREFVEHYLEENDNPEELEMFQRAIEYRLAELRPEDTATLAPLNEVLSQM